MQKIFLKVNEKIMLNACFSQTMWFWQSMAISSNSVHLHRNQQLFLNNYSFIRATSIFKANSIILRLGDKCRQYYKIQLHLQKGFHNAFKLLQAVFGQAVPTARVPPHLTEILGLFINMSIKMKVIATRQVLRLA